MNRNEDYKKEIVSSFLAIVLILALLLYGERISGVLGFITNVLKPFIIGGAMAYVLNLPMSFTLYNTSFICAKIEFSALIAS